MKHLLLVICLYLPGVIANAAEVSGVFIDDRVNTQNGDSLLLNGAGLREKLWLDVYVGSLYLPAQSGDVAEILSKPGPLRIQLDFIYKEVAAEMKRIRANLSSEVVLSSTVIKVHLKDKDEDRSEKVLGAVLEQYIPYRHSVFNPAYQAPILAERADIAEELSRLDSHMHQFIKTCDKSKEPAGRRLDFIAQEMLREANTIASKAGDTDFCNRVVNIKCRIDRLKEQIQNVE